MSTDQVAVLLVAVHKKLMAEQNDGRHGSPWFGEILRRFMDAWGSDPPARQSVFDKAVELGLSFRMSGDYAEDYRTIYYNPTDEDKK